MRKVYQKVSEVSDVESKLLIAYHVYLKHIPGWHLFFF